MMSGNRYELRKQIKSVRWVIFWVVLAQLAAEIAVQAVVSFMKNPPHEYIQIAIVEIIAIGIPIIVYGRSVWSEYGRNVSVELKIKGCGAHIFLMAAILGVTGQFVMMLLNIPANIYIQEVLKRETADAIPVALKWKDLMLGIPAVVVIPAILEEFWMRGIVFRAYNRCNTMVAVIFTTMVFALIHMRINELAGFLFMGVVSAMLLMRSDSLYAAMVYHAFSNFAALAFGFVLAGVIEYVWIIFGVAVLLFVTVFVTLLAVTKKPHVNRSFKAGSLMLNSIFSMPVILSIIVVAVRHFVL